MRFGTTQAHSSPPTLTDSGEFAQPDRSHELTDTSYRMADYTWFRIRGRLPDLPMPHYLGHGFAFSPQYDIRNVRQEPTMTEHVVIKIALSAGGVIAPKPGVQHRLVRRLTQVAVGDSHVTEMTGLEAFQLSNNLFQALYEAADDNSGRAKNVELAEAAETLIRDRLPYDWTVSRLANQLGVSREYLTRAFVERHGVPPHRFLLELRVQEACRRLKGTNDSVKKIFLDLGFKSHTSFSRTFQRYHHVTPSTYREQRQ